MGLAEREIAVLMYGYYVFPKPSVHGIPTAIDPADRSCRYLVQPPTVPGMAWLRGYQRPPRGCRGRCRRACERIPLRGRRRRAGGGCRVCRLTTDMRTTQGQVVFGHNIQAIITYSYIVEAFINRYRWTLLFNARRTHLLRISSTHKSICY
jgi:hypothetical protein